MVPNPAHRHQQTQAVGVTRGRRGVLPCPTVNRTQSTEQGQHLLLANYPALLQKGGILIQSTLGPKPPHPTAISMRKRGPLWEKRPCPPPVHTACSARCDGHLHFPSPFQDRRTPCLSCWAVGWPALCWVLSGDYLRPKGRKPTASDWALQGTKASLPSRFHSFLLGPLRSSRCRHRSPDWPLCPVPPPRFPSRVIQRGLPTKRPDGSISGLAYRTPVCTAPSCTLPRTSMA